MRSPQAHEVKAQITEFLAKVKTNQGATVIRHKRGIERMGQRTKAIREARAQLIA